MSAALCVVVFYLLADVVPSANGARNMKRASNCCIVGAPVLCRVVCFTGCLRVLEILGNDGEVHAFSLGVY